MCGVVWGVCAGCGRDLLVVVSCYDYSDNLCWVGKAVGPTVVCYGLRGGVREEGGEEIVATFVLDMCVCCSVCSTTGLRC